MYPWPGSYCSDIGHVAFRARQGSVGCSSGTRIWTTLPPMGPGSWMQVASWGKQHNATSPDPEVIEVRMSVHEQNEES